MLLGRLFISGVSFILKLRANLSYGSEGMILQENISEVEPNYIPFEEFQSKIFAIVNKVEEGD